MNNQVPASFAGCIGKINTPANVLTTGRAPAAAGKTTYAEPTCAEYEAMLDGTTPSPTFNQALAVALLTVIFNLPATRLQRTSSTLSMWAQAVTHQPPAGQQQRVVLALHALMKEALCSQT
jgi:hypothetical protein